MSLEQAIERNTAALEKLIEMLDPARVVGEQADTSKASKKKKAAALQVVPKTEAAQEPRPLEPSAPSGEPGASAAAATEAAAAPVAEPTRTDVSAKLTLVSASKGRDAAMKILAQVGANSLGQVKPEDYAAVICACELALS